LLRLPPKDSAQRPPRGHGLQQEVARYMFDVMCSSPDGSARCRLAILCCAVSSTPSTLDGCLLFLRSPIRDAVETRGEKTPAALAAIRYIYILCAR
jgi:hypothetical protein